MRDQEGSDSCLRVRGVLGWTVRGRARSFLRRREGCGRLTLCRTRAACNPAPLVAARPQMAGELARRSGWCGGAVMVDRPARHALDTACVGRRRGFVRRESSLGAERAPYPPDGEQMRLCCIPSVEASLHTPMARARLHPHGRHSMLGIRIASVKEPINGGSGTQAAQNASSSPRSCVCVARHWSFKSGRADGRPTRARASRDEPARSRARCPASF